MVEALKKIDKKLLIIASIIILLPVLLIIFLAIIQGCGNSNITPEKYEEKMMSAAQMYFKDKEPVNESEIKTVKLSTLVEKEYIKSTEKLLDDNTCKGSVTVRRNGSLIEQNDGGYLNYIVNLECDTYKTKTLKNEIMEDLTSEESGLYEDNNYYVYKGDSVNNYITFYGHSYRIMSIDENGIVKLLKIEGSSLDKYWDNKFNAIVNDVYGKNIYADSCMIKSLLDDYNNPKIISNSAKKHIVSNDVCIDAIDINNGAIGDYSCTNILEKQSITLINTSDYAKASLDPDCNSIYSKSCRNYNYLREMNLQTWTVNAVANDTYSVYYLSNGIIKNQEASRYQDYNIVIYIDGNEKILDGKGTLEEPYVIE